MKKHLLVVPVVALLAACGTTEKFEKRAEYENKRQEKYVERTIDKAPKWMTELPESKSAVYANGTGISRDFSMADEKAKLIALSKICMAAGGEVDKQSKMFMSDTDDVSVERSEMAIRAMCRGTDISGAEIVEIKRISEGSRYRSYALVALPLGEANALATRNDQRRAAAGSKARADRAFNEIDTNNRR
ncbi:MAG: hypothetical protein EBU66_16485 [Bacteroidetes bacterium]|nr:hypothetical protein [Bacteroidota bacterium]